MTQDKIDALETFFNTTRALRNERNRLLKEIEAWEKSDRYRDDYPDIVICQSGQMGGIPAGVPGGAVAVEIHLPFELMKSLMLKRIRAKFVKADRELEALANKILA